MLQKPLLSLFWNKYEIKSIKQLSAQSQQILPLKQLSNLLLTLKFLDEP